MRDLENKKAQHLEKIMKLLLPVTVYYPDKLKESQKRIKELQNVKKQTDKIQNEKEKAKENNDKEEVQKLNAEIAKNKEAEKKKSQSLESEICQFEAERVNDNKFLFLQYIHSELKYHAISVQKLSDLFNKISLIEPEEGLQDFIENYKVNVNLKEMGINIGEIMERKKRREKSQQVKRDQVFEDEKYQDNNINTDRINNNENNFDNDRIDI